MLLKKDDIIYLPKYFYGDRISDKFYVIGNSVSGKSVIIDNLIFKALKILGKTRIKLNIFLSILDKNIFNLKEFKGILISYRNTYFNKFREEIVVIGNDYLNYRDKLSIVTNADKIICLSGKVDEYLQNRNIINIPKRKKESTLNEIEWMYKILEIISKNIVKGDNLVIISFFGHPLFGGWFPNLLNKKSKENNFNCRYIPSITYIGYMYDSFFMRQDPMSSGFISIDCKKILSKKYIDISFQIIITRIGYSKGVYYVYNGNWKGLVLEELLILKIKLLNFYNENNIIYIISSNFREKLLLKDIEKAVNFWVPGFTSIFIDSVDK